MDFLILTTAFGIIFLIAGVYHMAVLKHKMEGYSYQEEIDHHIRTMWICSTIGSALLGASITFGLTAQ